MLWRLDAVELAERIQRKDVTAQQVLDTHHQHIHDVNPALNAIVLLNEQQRGEHLRPGPLHGVPFTVKDVFATQGLRSTAGAPGMELHIPGFDAASVTLLKGAGGMLLGKTNTPAFSADIQCSSPVLGRANNPWNPDMTTGGSSGGGAAAVACGMSALELGSDHGGSLRIPASFCGVVGFKPTAARVPMAGHLHAGSVATSEQHTIVCAGPIARRVRDVRLAMGVLGGVDGQRGPPRALRVAWIPSVSGLPMDPHLADALQHAVDRIQAAGHTVHPHVWDAEVWKGAFSSWSTLIGEELTTPIMAAARAWFRARAGTPRHSDVVRAARELRMDLTARVDSLLAQHDAILLPTTLCPAFTHRPMGTAVTIDGQECDYWLAAGAATSLASLTGHPALALPCGITPSGLPLSLQLVGRRQGDAELLDVAEVVESLLERLPFPDHASLRVTGTRASSR